MQELIRRSEIIERAAWRSLYRGASGRARRRLGLQVVEQDGVTFLSASRVDHLLLNRAIGLGTSADPGTDAVAAAVKHFEGRNIPRFWIHMGSGLRYSELPGLLLERGIIPYPRSWMKFVRRTARVEALPCELKIRSAAPRDAKRVGRILAPAFDLPEEAGALLAAGIGLDRWDYFVAEDDNRIVAAAAIYTRGDDGYLAFAATLPEARRRGCQRALMAVRLEHAQRMGCKRVFTETGMPVEGKAGSSYRNILRVGFDELHVRDNFAPEGTRWQNHSSSDAIAKSVVSPKRSRTWLKAVVPSGS
jgi:N-acetylglutamate synthase-like GNAT family acetyltransferase